MEYSNLQVPSRFSRVGKSVALVALIIGLGGAALLAFGKNTQQVADMDPIASMAMTAPFMQPSQVRSFGSNHLVALPAPRRDMSAMASAVGEIPDMQKRTTMNLILVGAATPAVGMLAGGYAAFFIPKTGGGGGGGTIAKDAIGDDVKAADWIQKNPFPTRSLVQGLKGDATYLVVTEDKSLVKYGINAVCTHLGCVVPWNKVENKFKCPCHGSQYDSTGKVVRGPAPLSLALAHLDEVDGKVSLSPWTEQDFRTGLDPWWK